ncbi:MAG: ABC transporter permease [Ruminococcus sp.]
MKRKIILSVLLLIITLLITVLFFISVNNVTCQMPDSIQMNYNLSSDAAPIKISQFERYSKKIAMRDVTFCSEQDLAKIKCFDITPVLTDENYFNVMNTKINGNLSKNKKAAVISSDLALRLYFKTDVIGKTIIIYNKEYTVSGVYQKPKGLINELSCDHKEHVYLYYKSDSNYKNAEITEIDYSSKTPSAPLIEQMNLAQYYSTDLGEKAKIINNFKSLFFLIIFLTFAIISFKIRYKLKNKLWSEIKDNLAENYLLKSIKSIPIKYLFYIAVFFGIPVVLICVFISLDFSIFIPPRYIPYDNIFDIPYYISKIIEHKNNLNSLSLMGNNYFRELYEQSFCLLQISLTCFVFFFCLSIHSIKSLCNYSYESG